MALELFYKKFVESAATWYKRSLATELNKIGVRYEDLMISEEKDMQEALQLADREVVLGRYRRLKRASDLCVKQKMLQDYAPNMALEPFKEELYPDLLKIRQRDEEFDLLNLHKK